MTNALQLEDFRTFEFTPQRKNDEIANGFVYVLMFQLGSQEFPIYVGRSKSFYRRMDDYFWKQFSAGTDFKIGTAIDYLLEHEEAKVVVHYKHVPDAAAVEANLIAQAKKLGFELLNGRVFSANDVIETAKGKVIARCIAILDSHSAEGGNDAD